jgi:hypothetical protein
MNDPRGPAARPTWFIGRFESAICVLQPIAYSLLVAFRYRHLPPPDRKGLARQITEPARQQDACRHRQRGGNTPNATCCPPNIAWRFRPYDSGRSCAVENSAAP